MPIVLGIMVLLIVGYVFLKLKIYFNDKKMEKEYQAWKAKRNQTAVDSDIGLMYYPFQTKSFHAEEFDFMADSLAEKYQVLEKFNGVLEADISGFEQIDRVNLYKNNTYSPAQMEQAIRNRKYHSNVSWLYSENYEYGRELALLKGWRKRKESILEINAEYVVIDYHSYPIKLGTLKAMHWNKKPKYRSYHYKGAIFAEIELPFSLKENFYLLEPRAGLWEINDENARVPLYENLPLIRFESREARDYSEKILSDKIQKYIAELGIDINDYSMLFKENKITLLILDASWINDEKEKEKVLETVEKIMNHLDKIAKEIENEDIGGKTL